MEEEHTPTIIQLIQLMDLAVIQLKDSYIFFIFPTLSRSPDQRDKNHEETPFAAPQSEAGDLRGRSSPSR